MERTARGSIKRNEAATPLLPPQVAAANPFLLLKTLITALAQARNAALEVHSTGSERCDWLPCVRAGRETNQLANDRCSRLHESGVLSPHTRGRPRSNNL
jgi:hypothetical protein